MDKRAQWMSIGDAAKYLGISRDTLRRWEKRGKIKPVRSPTNRRYYTKKQLNTLMEVGEKKIKLKSPKKKRKIIPLLAGVFSAVIAILIGLAVIFFLI